MKQIATWIEKDKGKHFDELFSGTEFQLRNARVDEVLWDEIEALLLTGGSDISAEWLEQPIDDPTVIKNPDEARDAWDFQALRQALVDELPILAICRGHQVLNVARGGTLHLDIFGHNLPEQKYGNVQELRFAPNATIRISRVNSSHHQAIAELGEASKPKPGTSAIISSSKFACAIILFVSAFNITRSATKSTSRSSTLSSAKSKLWINPFSISPSVSAAK